MRFKFYDDSNLIIVESPSRDLRLSFKNVDYIEEKIASDLIKEGYEVDKGRYIVIHLNAKGDYEIATIKLTKDLSISIM